MSANTHLIRRGAIVANDWTVLDDESAVPAQGKLLVSLARLRKDRQVLPAGRTGVRLPNTEDVLALWPEIRDCALIAVEFPVWGDGRAFSQARLLRERCGFTGELRAVGDVGRDQLQFMQRCGIDAFELRPGEDAEAALAGLRDFDLAYQNAADSLPNVWAARRSR